MKITLTMGFFGSVHMGHRQLLRAARNYAASAAMTPAVYTLISYDIGFKQLYSYENRVNLLKNEGISLIISDIFSEELKNKSGKDFLDDLTKRYDIGAFFCGYDYTFGFGASCNAEFLLDYATHNQIKCFILPPVLYDGQKVSTTRIKQLLSNGDVEQANMLLCTPFFMKGKVIHGRGVGTNFGYPTANLDYCGFLPKEGVYKTIVSFDEERHIGVTNIGSKPTFNESSVSIETMIADFKGDLYGKEIKIEFIKYLRPITKFIDGNALRRQIQKDLKEALC